MQKCLECGEKFKYKQVLHTVIGPFGYKPVSCSHCGQNYAITFGSRLKLSLAVVAVPMVLRLLVFRELSAVGTIIFFLMLAIPMLFIVPNFLSYRKVTR